MGGSSQRYWETILAVDDDQTVLHVIEAVLSNGGYSVITAADPQHAVELFRQYRFGVDLVIVSSALPGMTGPEFISRLIPLRPDLQFLYIVDSAATPAVLELMAHEGLPYLEKPFTIRSLHAKVRGILDAKISVRNTKSI